MRKEIKALHFVIPLLAEDADWIENGLTSPVSAPQFRRNGTAGVKGLSGLLSREYLNANTIRNAATSRCTIGTALKSTGEDRQGTLLRYRRCSMSARRCKTTGRLCGATNHKADIECEAQMARGSAPAQARDPKQPRTWRGHPRGHTCPAIMNQFRSRIAAE